MANTATVQIAWPRDESALLLALVAAVTASPAFRGTRKESLYSAFHDPATRLYRKHSDTKAGKTVKLVVTYVPSNPPEVTIKMDVPEASAKTKEPVTLPYAAPLGKIGESLIRLLENSSKHGSSAAFIDFVVTKVEVDLRLWQVLPDGQTKPRSDTVPAVAAVTAWLGHVNVAQNADIPSIYTSKFSISSGAWDLESWQLLAKVEPITERDPAPSTPDTAMDEAEEIIESIKGDRQLVLGTAAMLIAEQDPSRLDNLIMSIAPFGVFKLGKLAKLKKLSKLAILKMIKRPKAVQMVRGKYHVDVRPTTELLDHVLELRKATYGVTAKDFKRNVSVWDVTIDGKRQYVSAGNVPANTLPKGDVDLHLGLHSEPLVLKDIKSRGKNYKVHQIYTERKCCRNCQEFLDGYSELNNVPIFHSVRTDYDGTKVEALMMEGYSIKVD